MKIRIASLSIACAAALAACGGESPADQETGAAGPASTPAVADAPAVAPSNDAAPSAASTPADAKPAAVVENCSTTIEGNDAMQFNVGSITVPASCSDFTIHLRHTGTMPATAMGHNVVVSLASDRQAIASEGAQAGQDAAYVKPGDSRVIAHSEIVGGGETTSVTFKTSQLQGSGPYEFFCSFPGHWTVMRGSIQTG